MVGNRRAGAPRWRGAGAGGNWVPRPQIDPIPQPVLNEAKRLNIRIRDVWGNLY
jgi:hypothetical protein